MLEPCDPCVCVGAPCEQCSFGYQDAKTRHDIMKRYLLNYHENTTCHGWRVAETYMRRHPDWKKDVPELADTHIMSAEDVNTVIVEERPVVELKDLAQQFCTPFNLSKREHIALELTKAWASTCNGKAYGGTQIIAQYEWFCRNVKGD